MTRDELKFLVGSVDDGAMGVVQRGIRENNPIWRQMFDLGWGDLARQAPYYPWRIERPFMKLLTLANSPGVAAEALHRFLKGLSTDQITAALTRAGDEPSVLMSWVTEPVRTRRTSDHPHRFECAALLIEEAAALGCDLNATAMCTAHQARNGKERAEHTALSWVVVEGMYFLSNPNADGPSSTGQKADLLNLAAALVQAGARVEQRTAAALTQMVPADAAVPWIEHLQSLGACSPADVLAMAGRLKKDPDNVAMIQAMAARATLRDLAGRAGAGPAHQ